MIKDILKNRAAQQGNMALQSDIVTSGSFRRAGSPFPGTNLC